MVDMSMQVAQTQDDVVNDLEKMCKGVLVMHGILVSPDEGERMREAIREYVTRSVEIEQRIIMSIERYHGPSAA